MQVRVPHCFPGLLSLLICMWTGGGSAADPVGLPGSRIGWLPLGSAQGGTAGGSVWRKGESRCSSSSASILSRFCSSVCPATAPTPPDGPRHGHSPTGQPLTWLQPPWVSARGARRGTGVRMLCLCPGTSSRHPCFPPAGSQLRPPLGSLRSWSQAPPTAGPPRCSAGGPSAEGSLLAVPWPSWPCPKPIPGKKGGTTAPGLLYSSGPVQQTSRPSGP